jgi:hypothetical protein
MADPWIMRIPFPPHPDSPILYQAIVRAYQARKDLTSIERSFDK